MARALVEFVKANIHRATPAIALSDNQLPNGFGSMSITSESGEWWSGEHGGNELSEIPLQVASRIRAKNKLVPRYRLNLPSGAKLWLLLYTAVTVSRSVPMMLGVEDWRLSFDFDRVFWLCCLENRVVEIRRSDCTISRPVFTQ